MARLFLTFGYEIRKYPNWKFPVLSIFDLAIEAKNRHLNSIRFLQIGGNDGIYVNPLRKYYLSDEKWIGHIYEPNPEMFTSLQRNILDITNRINAHQLAVSNKEGISTLFIQDPTSRPHASEICSMNSKAFSKQKNYGASLSKVSVRTTTLNDELKKYNWSDFEVLQIDTEGYECEIIEGIDFSRFRPKLMQIEVGHLSPAQINQLTRKIAAGGYSIYWGGHQADMVCLAESKP
jgi:FkbM family methyltransferase